MTTINRLVIVLSLAIAACGGKKSDTTTTTTTASDPAHDPAKVAEAQAQFAGLKKSCDDAADAIKERAAAKPLYERLGGQAAIKAVVTDLVAAKRNDPIMAPTMEGIDDQKFIDGATIFLSMGFGGTEKYEGKPLPESHRKLNLTDVHFMQLGAALGEILKKYNVPEPETQEVFCALASLHDQVVLSGSATAAK